MTRRLLVAFIAAAVCLASAGVGAADVVNVTFEGHFGGETEAVAVSGNYAYIGEGQDLVVLDITDPASPTELGRLSTADVVVDIAVSCNYVYAADDDNGLVIVDVTDQSAPVPAGSYDTAGTACGVAVSGDYAYVADYPNGLVIVDITDKTAPTLAGSCDAGRACGVTVSGDYAYVAGGCYGLVIVDVTDPTAPTSAGCYGTTGSALGVSISGSYAYIADCYNGLVIVDVSNKAAPVLAGSYETAGYAQGVAVSGDYAYVFNEPNGLVIVDVTDPTAPTCAGCYAGYVQGVAVSGNYAYAADHYNGLVIVDVSDPTAPTRAGRYGTTGSALGVAISCSYAYIADGYVGGLVIVDISDLRAPTLAGSYCFIHCAEGVAVSGNYAYVADYGADLVIMDVSDPTAPTRAGRYRTAGYASGVAVSGDYAYVADGFNGLVIVDVSNKSTPVLAGSYDTAGYASGVAVSGDYAYVAEWGNGLAIVDVSNKSAPVLAGSYAGYAGGVAVSGDYAYVAGGYDGLVIVDITDKEAPMFAGSYNTAGDAYGVAVSGDYAYVADDDNGLVIVDVSNKTAPTLAGSYNTAGDARGVAVSGDYAYVADYYNGLVILRTDASGADTTPPILTITSPADGTTVTTPSITVTGTASDASGIASVTVNGALASGALNWSTWSAEVTLAEGENTITVVATDDVGNVATQFIVVNYAAMSHVPYFSQCDSRWGSDQLGGDGPTICSTGCALTSAAMVMAYYGVDTDPQKLNDAIGREGYDASYYIYWSAVRNACHDETNQIEYSPGTVTPFDETVLDNHLDAGHPVIVDVGGHFVVVTGRSDGTYYINDPGFSTRSTLDDYPTRHGMRIFSGNLPPLTCAIELREQSTTSTIDEIDVGHSFDICVDDSTGDIKEVRFSSEESQDGNPTGTWTSWYDWDTSSGDWNAKTKIKTWSFATGGEKEVWAEIKDGSGDAIQCNASIFAHPGYAIIVAGQDRGSLWPPKASQKCAMDHSANNAYRALHNLGFDDDHIFYLNDESQQIDGQNVVDKSASLDDLRNTIDEIKYNIGESSTPLILYLVGHGNDDVFDFYTESDVLTSDDLRGMIEPFHDNPMLIVIGSCYSGSFITLDYAYSTDSISDNNRIIITACHDDEKRWSMLGLGGWYHSSDRFWGNLNKGLSVKDAFIANTWPGDQKHLWLDDNGDSIGHPPDNIEDDGILASATTIGVPGTDDLELTSWCWSRIHSPGELRVYDSQDRVTGLVNGEVKEEIPDSVYDEQDKIVAIFTPSDSYRYEIAGTDNGTYGLEVASVEDGEADTFVVTNVSTTNETTHQYDINWSTLSQGVNMSIDADGDGIFEQNITIRLPVTSFTYTPENPTVNQAMTFDATTSYDPDGNITSYDWNFGDGNTTNTTEKMITHSYTSAGDYNVILTVTDDDGAMNSTSKTITINPLRGDLNGDDQITPADTAIALQIAAGSRPFDDAADVSGDGMVTSLDALMILQAAVGSISL